MHRRILDLIFDSFRFLKKEKINFYISSVTISICILVVSLIYILSLKVIQTIKSSEKPSIIINYTESYENCEDCNQKYSNQCPECDIYISDALKIDSNDTKEDVYRKNICKDCIDNDLKLNDGDSFMNYRDMSLCHEKCVPPTSSSYSLNAYDEGEHYQDLNKNRMFDPDLEEFMNNEYYGSRVKTSCYACINFRLLSYRNQIRYLDEINDEINFTNKHSALSKYERFVGRYYFKNRPDRILIPFPAQSEFTVDNTIDNVKDLNKLINKIKNMEFVSDIDNESMVNYKKFISYTKINKAISSIIPILIVLILIVPSMVISNTVRLVIYSKRDVLKTLRILGEKDFYIRLPFILEGIWQGILGGFLAYMILLFLDIAGINILMSKFINVMLSEISTKNIVHSSLIVDTQSFFAIIFVGILLGIFGSIRATMKFLK